MSALKLASRYAKSLLNFATEQNKLEEIKKDVLFFNQVAASGRDFVLMLQSPIINTNKKIKIIQQIFENKVNPITLSFFKIIINKKRERHLLDITLSFIQQYNVFKKISTVKLVSAVALDEAVKTEISKLVKDNVKADIIELSTEINPGIIGGFILKYDDKLYDASIIRQLNILKKDYTEESYVKKLFK